MVSTQARPREPARWDPLYRLTFATARVTACDSNEWSPEPPCVRVHTVDVKQALAAIGCESFVALSALPTNWHGDNHWVVRNRAGTRYSLRSVRLGRKIRWEERRRYDVAVVRAQLRAAESLVAAGLPFMVRVAGPAVRDQRLVVMFGWLEGEPAVVATAPRAFAVGRLLWQLHHVDVPLDDRLPVHDAVIAGQRSIDELQSIADVPFLARARDVLGRLESRGARRRVVTHGDCNFPNVLWRDNTVSGLVDFDQIGLCDPLEELAWVVKWWSRPHGVASHVHDRALANAVLRGYGVDSVDREWVADVLWMSGCLNGNSVLRVLGAASEQRPMLLAAFETRADALAALV